MYGFRYSFADVLEDVEIQCRRVIRSLGAGIRYEQVRLKKAVILAMSAVSMKVLTGSGAML